MDEAVAASTSPITIASTKRTWAPLGWLKHPVLWELMEAEGAAGQPDAAREAFQRATQAAIAERVPLMAAMFVALMGLGAVFEVSEHPERWKVLALAYGIEVFVCVAAAIIVHTWRSTAPTVSIAAASLLTLCVSSYFPFTAASNEMLVVCLILLLFGFQVLFPWNVPRQLQLCAAAATGLVFNAVAGTGRTIPWPYAITSVFVTGVLSSVGAGLRHRYRLQVFQRAAELERANALQRQEMEVSNALLRVSAVLNHSLSAPAQLVTNLTRELPRVIGADFALIFLWEDGRAVYRVADVHGPASAVAEELRSLEFSPESLPFFHVVERDRRVEITGNEHQSLIPKALMERWRVRSLLATAIRRGEHRVGIMMVGFSDRPEPFSPVQHRLLVGIAHQTAVALENARLMEAARQANQVKSEFVATMSHELRTPLNVILGYLDLMHEGSMGDVSDEQRDILDRMRRRGIQLLDLITATLDLNRLEGGKMPIVLSMFSVDELFASLREHVPASWRKGSVRLEWHANGGGGVRLHSDRAKVEMALRNLVHNALKYTDRGAVRVDAEVSPDQSMLELRVVDTGIGISSEQLPIIFEMFRQAEGVAARDGGVGLGLYIVKRLAQILGGSVAAESTPGIGSRFTLRLPTARSA